jgi:hypothetical protein
MWLDEGQYLLAMCDKRGTKRRSLDRMHLSDFSGYRGYVWYGGMVVQRTEIGASATVFFG